MEERYPFLRSTPAERARVFQGAIAAPPWHAAPTIFARRRAVKPAARGPLRPSYPF